ncbi:unnamed protein product, partial [Symbiodinium sp. CCMP2456]
VNATGDIQLLGALDIDPSYTVNSRLSLKQSDAYQKSVGTQFAKGPLSIDSPFFRLSQDDQAYLNTTLSVMLQVNLGGSLSVFDSARS